MKSEKRPETKIDRLSRRVRPTACADVVLAVVTALFIKALSAYTVAANVILTILMFLALVLLDSSCLYIGLPCTESLTGAEDSEAVGSSLSFCKK